MRSAPDLSSDQDINQFLVYVKIKSYISYTTIRDFTSWAVLHVLREERKQCIGVANHIICVFFYWNEF